MFARHLAWLHAKPSKQSETRFKIYSDGEVPSPLLELPDVGYARYLINYLYEIGFSKSTIAGVLPIDWIDLNSWSQATKTDLTNWEALTMIYCSKSYAEQYHLSNETVVPAPYQSVEIDKGAVNNRIANLFRSMMKK